MQIVGTHEDVRKKFLAKLMRCHTKVINSAADVLRKAARANAAAAIKPESARTSSATAPSPLDTIPTLSEVIDTRQPDSSSKPPV